MCEGLTGVDSGQLLLCVITHLLLLLVRILIGCGWGCDDSKLSKIWPSWHWLCSQLSPVTQSYVIPVLISCRATGGG